MSVYSIVFYLIGAVMVISTLLAVTRKNIAHSILYLVVSFLGSALLFFLMGAPLLGIYQVIIYAGAIMVLFLFIVMMLKIETPVRLDIPPIHYIVSGCIGLIYVVSWLYLLLNAGDKAKQTMPASSAAPGVFSRYLFQHQWLAIELVSLLLLIAVIGALQLGLIKPRKNASKGDTL